MVTKHLGKVFHCSRGDGSIPLFSAKLYPLRQVGKAADFDSAMRWFESIRGCQ